MKNLASIITFLVPGISIPAQCEIADFGDGPVILRWNHPSQQPTQLEIDAAELPAEKAARKVAINAEVRARLIARFGDANEQVSRSLGIYGAAEKSALETGIAATIDASNVAADAVMAATTIAEVEAVTVAWPVI